MGALDRDVQVAMAENVCEMGKAHYSPRLSGLDFDQGTQTFWATLDRLPYHTPEQIVAKVLEAHGFLPNIENFLASLDTFCLGFRVAIDPKSLNQEVPIAKEFMPCLRFRLPERKVTGPLLQRFYDEVSGYEAEIARLQGKGKSNLNKAEQKKIGDLEKENQQLKQQIGSLNALVRQLRNQNVQAMQQRENHQFLPENVRLATVTDVDLKRRKVTFKVSKGQVTASLNDMFFAPDLNSQALLVVDQGQVLSVAFMEQRSPNPGSVLAGKVLHRQGNRIKVLTDDREHHQISLQDAREIACLSEVRRGHRLTLWMHEGAIIAFRPSGRVNPQTWVRNVHESIVCQQIEISRVMANQDSDQSNNRPEGNDVTLVQGVG